MGSINSEPLSSEIQHETGYRHLHSRFGHWAWQVRHPLIGWRVLIVASFYPLFWVSLLLDRLLSSQRPGLGHVALARRDAAAARFTAS